MTNYLSIFLVYALLLAFVKAEIQEAEFAPALRESYKNKTKFTSDRKYCIKLYLCTIIYVCFKNKAFFETPFQSRK